MTAIELRTEITRLLSDERNTIVLEAIRMLLRREDPEEDFSTEELAELDAENERALRGHHLHAGTGQGDGAPGNGSMSFALG